MNLRLLTKIEFDNSERHDEVWTIESSALFSWFGFIRLVHLLNKKKVLNISILRNFWKIIEERKRKNFQLNRIGDYEVRHSHKSPDTPNFLLLTSICLDLCMSWCGNVSLVWKIIWSSAKVSLSALKTIFSPRNLKLPEKKTEQYWIG